MCPQGMTILKAIEWAGYRLVRGVGCRAGFCGACATVYRLKGDHQLYFGLACQTVVQPDMILAQIPFFPAPRAAYRLEQLKPAPEQLYQLYPEVLRCLGCGTCTKACPQDLDVMDYMAAAMRGDIAATACEVVRLHHVRAVRGPLSGGRGAVQRGDPGAAPVWQVPVAAIGAPGEAHRRDRGRRV